VHETLKMKRKEKKKAAPTKMIPRQIKKVITVNQ
jgi:hypothetical protein